MSPETTDRFGAITFSPGGERWFEYGPPADRMRLGFHDYAAIYGVPGLYERVFYEELGMCSASVVPRLYGDVLAALGRPPADEHVLDVGAGSGMAGVTLRELGVGRVTGVDLEPAAAVATRRDRPGVYDDYLIGDISDPDGLGLELRALGGTAMLAVAAVGSGHIPPNVLRAAVELVVPGGLFAFAVTPPLLPESNDPEGLASGYPALLSELLGPRERARKAFVHRRQTDGTPHEAVALVGQRPR